MKVVVGIKAPKNLSTYTTVRRLEGDLLGLAAVTVNALLDVHGR
jgi:hypothetical protein